MPRSALVLAALADAAVRGLEPVSARLQTSTDDSVDVAVVDDTLRRRWLVRAPRNTAASVRLEQESRLLENLAGWLPFAVPEVAGTAALLDGGRAVVYRYVPGTPLNPGDLDPGPGLAAALGRALAAVHDLPARVVEDAGFPAYGAEEYRRRRLAEVDRAAATGQVPGSLLARWEQAIEAGAWRFAPCPVHGDLAAENVLVDGTKITGILDWAEARVADPADDFSWIAVGAHAQALDSVIEAYAMGRREPPDRDLARRARLAGELAVARWLLHGVGSADAAVVADARSMLADVEAAAADRPL